MTMEFRVKITLGNDAMRTKRDIADALAYLAEYDLTRDGAGLAPDTDEAVTDDEGRIYDVNGNRVGTWTIAPEFER